MLEQAARADIAHRHLIGALRELHEVPGNLLVRPQSVLRNLFEEVGWQRDLAETPKLLEEELAEARHLLAEWEDVAPSSAAPPLGKARPLQRLAGWFTRRRSPTPASRPARPRRVAPNYSGS